MAERDRRKPRYARYSPDTASDESSEEELPNFTLISEEVILPEGSKRQRKTRVSLPPPIEIEDPAPVLRSQRRARNSLPSEEAHEVTEPRRRGRPPRSSPAPLPSPRRLKRRRIVESDNDSELSEQDEDEEEEEPVRPWPHRRSAGTSTVAATPTEAPGIRSRESSSDLSPPPESLMDVDSELEETAEQVTTVEEEKSVRADVELQPLPKKRGRPPGVKSPKTALKVPSLQIPKNAPSSANSTSGNSAIEVEMPDRSPDLPATNAMLLDIPEKQVTERVRELSIHEEDSIANFVPGLKTEAQSAEELLPKVVIPSVEPIQQAVEPVPAKATPVPKKANSAVKRVPPTSITTTEKEQTSTPQHPTPIPQLDKKKAAPKRAPRSAPPTVEAVRPRPLADSSLRMLESATSRPFEIQKRVREIATPRPTSAGIGGSSLPSPPVRGHTRHRSMDIASLLNDDAPPPAKSYSPVYPPPLPHMDLMQPTRSFGNTTPESFMRSGSGTSLGGNRPQFAPVIAGAGVGSAPLTPNSPNITKAPFESLSRSNSSNTNNNHMSAQGSGRVSHTRRSRAKPTSSDFATPANNSYTGGIASDLLVSNALAAEGKVDDDSDSVLSEMDYIILDDPLPIARATRSRTARKPAQAVIAGERRELQNGLIVSSSTVLKLVDSTQIGTLRPGPRRDGPTPSAAAPAVMRAVYDKDAAISSMNFFNAHDATALDLTINLPIPLSQTTTAVVNRSLKRRRASKRKSDEIASADPEAASLPDLPGAPQDMSTSALSTVMIGNLQNIRRIRRPRVPRTPRTPRAPRAARARPALPYHINVQEGKPLPLGKPPVWAEKRQQLCEALPYYRAYQSGAYSDNGVVKGFLIDKEVGVRDKFTNEIVICSVGGGKAQDAEGNMVQARDQSSGGFSLAFKRAMLLKQPIAIIAGQGNRISPSKLPHYYNVLDWFHVTDLWCELVNNVKTGFVRLEKIELSKLSWWTPMDIPPPPVREGHLYQTASTECETCHTPSKEIYKEGWVCLNSNCEKHFDFGRPIDNSKLDYNEDFMMERTAYTSARGDMELPSLAPDPISMQMAHRMGLTGSEEVCAKGIVCPKCKGCSRRIDWHGWKCEHHCGFEHSVPLRTISVTEAIAQGNLDYRGYHLESQGIKRSDDILGFYNVFEYSIPGPNPEAPPIGFIKHFKSCGVINTQKDGPNDLFHAMQAPAFGLKRRPARQPGSVGEILTGHWATNWGAPYKFVVRQATRGFDEAPIVILKALKRLTWAGAQAANVHAEPFDGFNELLSLGYMEKSAIGYHDDGEKELGPTIATLSLGCSAMMSLRPKVKSKIGPASRNAKGTKKVVLQMVLDHGDIVIMHGADIQKFYEHQVEPLGKLRFALTCRYVKPELMANAEETADAIQKGTLPAGHEQYDYDGDVNASPDVEMKEAPTEDQGSQVLQTFRAAIIAGELRSDHKHAIRELLDRDDRIANVARGEQ